MLEERAFATMVSLPKELGEKSGLFVTGGFGLGSKDGVRNLGRCIETIVSRLNMIRLIQGSLEMPDTNKFIEKLPFKATKIPIIKQSEKFKITRDIVDNILDKIKVNESFHHMYL